MSRVLACCVALCVSWSLVGCGTTPKRSADTATLTPDQRTAEARRLIELAIRAEEDGKIDDAISLYRQSLESSGEIHLAWNNLGVLLMKTQNYSDAVGALQIAAELEPRDPRPMANIGLSYLEIGWAEDALQYYTRALERDPSFKPALRGGAKAARQLNMADEATLDRIRRGMLVEDDPGWRSFFERERFRVEAAARSQRIAPGY